MRNGFIIATAGRPEMYDDHLIEWMSELVRRAGGHQRQPRGPRTCHVRPLSRQQKRRINQLRPTHTLQELGQMFNRHPATIADCCTVRADFRGKRRRPTASRLPAPPRTRDEVKA